MPKHEKTKASRFKQPAIVLVIEDIPEHVDLLTEVLERECAPVFVQAVDSFSLALQHLQKNTYDLVICGGTVQNEKVNAIVKELLDAANGVPFLVITGSGDEAIAARLIKKGVTDYVVKNRETLELLPKFFQKYLSPDKLGRRSQKTAKKQQALSSPKAVKAMASKWKATLPFFDEVLLKSKDAKLKKQLKKHLQESQELLSLIEQMPSS